MRIGKKILIYLFCGLLTFSVVSSSYYKTVHAFEYVGGALAFEEALKWLLAAIGITATAGMTDAYWDAYGDDFVDYAIQNGSTQQEVAEWQLKACEGILDKASNVWTQFKSWASSLVSSGTGGGSVSSLELGSSLSDVTDFMNNKFNINFTVNPTYANTPVYAVIYSTNSSGVINRINCIIENKEFSVKKNANNIYSVYGGNSNSLKFLVNNSNGVNGAYFTDGGDISFTLTTINNAFFSNNIINDASDPINAFVIFGDTGDVTDSNFESLDGVNTDDLDVISSSGIDEADDEVAIPYPGVSDSDNTLSNDTYQDIVDKINDGTITQEQGIEQIQELLRVITYDTVTDEVVPPQKNDDGTNKTKDDALKENKENAGFTLAGLENVFPFCIPFDIYAFMTLLVAEPECPEFDFPIKTVNGQEETIHVDLQPFEPVAVVVRYVFDFLFIVGLAMLTRSLIGGGSSD